MKLKTFKIKYINAVDFTMKLLLYLKRNINVLLCDKHISAFHSPTNETPDWFYYLRRFFLYVTLLINTYGFLIGYNLSIFSTEKDLYDYCVFIVKYLVTVDTSVKLYMAMQQTQLDEIFSTMNEIYSFECWDESQRNMLKKTRKFCRVITKYPPIIAGIILFAVLLANADPHIVIYWKQEKL